MTSSEQNVRNSSFVSIRKGRSQNVLSDTYEDEKAPIPRINITVLRAIGRTVRAIKKRMESVVGANGQQDTGSGRTAPHCQTSSKSLDNKNAKNQ
ncbi:MAG TPA: hypothetical protein VJL58_05005 [Pyrinomonadaceae bacterium]|nr:hypothetical protein [Pyrinomonadaceae bacterium]